MKKKSVFSLLIALLCLLCLLTLAACDEEPKVPGEGGNGDHVHTFGAWTETRAATCTEKGLRTRTCACGESENEEIAMAAHKWGAWSETVPAKCNASGSSSRTCTVCGGVDTVAVAATGEHNCNTSNVCLDCGTAVSYTTVGIIYGENSNTNTAYVSSVDTEIPANIVLPHYYNGKPLTRIPSAVFQNKTALESIVLPTTLTTIGEEAFSGCTNLKSVNIPTSVTEIGQGAFTGCDKVMQKENGLCYVDRWVVCTESIANGSNSEAELKLRADTVGIACYGCWQGSAPKKLHIPASVAYINSYAFCAQNFEQVTFADHSQLRVLGDAAFYGCYNLKSMDFGDNSQLISIGEKAFAQCQSMVEIDFGDNSQLQSIGDFAFSRDYMHSGAGLTTITIPASVTKIGYGAFQNCLKLTSVIFEENSQLESISMYAFADCPELTTLAIPPSVQTVDSGAFNGSTKLIRIVGGVSYVDKWVIGADSNITTATLPADTVGIGNNAFYGCDSLTAVYITDLAAWCNITFGNYNANPLNYAHNLYVNGNLVTHLEIPAGVTCIKGYAFYDCTSIISVSIPASVTSIGYGAFRQCDGLVEIDFGDNSQLTSIGDYAFYNCAGLTSITIPDSVTSIGFKAFYGCDGIIQSEGGVFYVGRWAIGCAEILTNATLRADTVGIGGGAFCNLSRFVYVVIPESVKYISNRAFSNLQWFTTVYYAGGASDWSSITIDSSNYYLTSATHYYYSAEQPTTAGNWWYYGNNDEPAVWPEVEE